MKHYQQNENFKRIDELGRCLTPLPLKFTYLLFVCGRILIMLIGLDIALRISNDTSGLSSMIADISLIAIVVFFAYLIKKGTQKFIEDRTKISADFYEAITDYTPIDKNAYSQLQETARNQNGITYLSYRQWHRAEKKALNQFEQGSREERLNTSIEEFKSKQT